MIVRDDLSFFRATFIPGATLTAVRVSAVVCMHARGPGDPDFGWSWPSVETIAREAEVSVAAVHRALAWLETNGLLVVERRTGRGHTNRYWCLAGHPPVASQLTKKTTTATADAEAVKGLTDETLLPLKGLTDETLSPVKGISTRCSDTGIGTTTTTTTTLSADSAEVFEQAWAAYPKRPNNSRAAAKRQWDARVKQGCDPQAMLQGTKLYAEWCRQSEREPRFIKQAATFYGPDCHWESDYATPEPPDRRAAPAPSTAGLTAEPIYTLMGVNDPDTLVLLGYRPDDKIAHDLIGIWEGWTERRVPFPTPDSDTYRAALADPSPDHLIALATDALARATYDRAQAVFTRTAQEA